SQPWLWHTERRQAADDRGLAHGNGDDPESPEDCMNWLLLLAAGLFEIGWAIGLKYTEGFTRFWPTIGTALAMVISVVMLGVAMKVLPVGSAYAVWVGVGAVGTVVQGIFLIGDAATLARQASVGVMVACMFGLKL